MTFLIGILAGFCIALMSAVNERLRAHLGAPFLTACVSFTVGLAVILPIALFGGGTFPFSGETAAAAPWWVWCGGLLGLMSLSSVVITFPKLGAVQAAVMPILGQVLAGVLIDGFGWLNAPQTPFSGSRLLGVLLVLAGAKNFAVGLYMALVPMFVGYLAFGYGLARVKASTAITLTLFEPVVAALLAVAIVGERLAWQGWVGMVLILLCLVCVTWPAKSPLANAA